MSESTPITPPPSAPPIAVNTQYVKDLSFEVPGAPQIFSTLRSQPQINLGLDVKVQKLPSSDQQVFEVTLHLRAEAFDREAQAANDGDTAKKGPVFIAELAYAGIFTLTNVPENALEPVLLVECPRLLFPFARNILADTTREGGFPPVLLQPIDFVGLWQSRRNQALAAQAQAGNA
jgi:preprotein translocase subunit SecB